MPHVPRQMHHEHVVADVLAAGREWRTVGTAVKTDRQLSVLRASIERFEIRMVGKHTVEIAECHDADGPRLVRQIRDLRGAPFHLALRNDSDRLDSRRERAAILADPSVVCTSERGLHRGIGRSAYRSRYGREANRDVDPFLVHVAYALGRIVSAGGQTSDGCGPTAV